MIPSVIVAEVAGPLGDALATGFGPSAPRSRTSSTTSWPSHLAKGPYLSIALRFEPTDEGGGRGTGVLAPTACGMVSC